ncbi:hypothetical protein H0G86_000846 [Trichoderma simmonsii]|uniref:Uncharacterized protein n=1 Tax=Trichoderma simmonsii TaxID=1491479 RepID=A0A8G0L0G1_9HYPO|nr:hypothetical protein H0G86_000846 [Trichoderma simmonsii]
MTGASMAQTSRQTLGIQLCKSGTKKRIGLVFVFGALLFLDRDGWLGIRTTQRPQAGTPMDEEGFAPSTWVPYLPCHREADRFMPKVLPGSPYVRRTCGTKEKGGAACPTPHSTYSGQSGLQESLSTAKWPFYEKDPHAGSDTSWSGSCGEMETCL